MRSSFSPLRPGTACGALEGRPAGAANFQGWKLFGPTRESCPREPTRKLDGWRQVFLTNDGKKQEGSRQPADGGRQSLRVADIERLKSARPPDLLCRV